MIPNTFEKRYINYSTYVEMKNLNDSFDLDNFEQYETYYKENRKDNFKTQNLRKMMNLSL